MTTVAMSPVDEDPPGVFASRRGGSGSVCHSDARDSVGGGVGSGERGSTVEAVERAGSQASPNDGMRREWNFALSFHHEAARIALQCSPYWEPSFVDPESVENIAKLDRDVAHCPLMPALRYTDLSAVVNSNGNGVAGTRTSVGSIALHPGSMDVEVGNGVHLGEASAEGEAGGDWWVEKAKHVEGWYAHVTPDTTLLSFCRACVLHVLKDPLVVSVDGDNNVTGLRMGQKLACPFLLCGRHRCFQFRFRLHDRSQLMNDAAYAVGTIVNQRGYLFLVRCSDEEELEGYLRKLFIPYYTNPAKLGLDVNVQYNPVTSGMLAEQQELYGELLYEDRDAAVAFSLPMYPIHFRPDFSPAKTVGVGSISCMTLELGVFERVFEDATVAEVTGMPKYKVNQVVLCLDVEDVARMGYPNVLSTDQYSELKMKRLLEVFPDGKLVGQQPTTVMLGGKAGRGYTATFSYEPMQCIAKAMLVTTLIDGYGVTALYLTRLGGGAFDSYLYLYEQLLGGVRFLPRSASQASLRLSRHRAPNVRLFEGDLPTAYSDGRAAAVILPGGNGSGKDADVAEPAVEAAPIEAIAATEPTEATASAETGETEEVSAAAEAGVTADTEGPTEAAEAAEAAEATEATEATEAAETAETAEPTEAAAAVAEAADDEADGVAADGGGPADGRPADSIVAAKAEEDDAPQAGEAAGEAKTAVVPASTTVNALYGGERSNKSLVRHLKLMREAANDGKVPEDATVLQVAPEYGGLPCHRANSTIGGGWHAAPSLAGSCTQNAKAPRGSVCSATAVAALLPSDSSTSCNAAEARKSVRDTRSVGNGGGGDAYNGSGADYFGNEDARPTAAGLATSPGGGVNGRGGSAYPAVGPGAAVNGDGAAGQGFDDLENVSLHSESFISISGVPRLEEMRRQAEALAAETAAAGASQSKERGGKGASATTGVAHDGSAMGSHHSSRRQSMDSGSRMTDDNSTSDQVSPGDANTGSPDCGPFHDLDGEGGNEDAGEAFREVPETSLSTAATLQTLVSAGVTDKEKAAIDEARVRAVLETGTLSSTSIAAATVGEDGTLAATTTTATTYLVGPSLRDVYIRCCDLQHCRPNSYLLKKLPTDPQFTNSVEEIDLTSNYLGRNGFVAVLNLLEHLPRLQRVIFNSMALDNTDVEHMCEALSRHPFVTTVELMNNVKITLPSTRFFTRMLRANPSIRCLRLDGTRIGEAVIAKLEEEAVRGHHEAPSPSPPPPPPEPQQAPEEAAPPPTGAEGDADTERAG